MPALEPDGRLRLLVFGGSQGARVMADIVPAAIERLDPALRARLAIVQQARDEDGARVAAAYDRLGVTAEVAPFFADLPARIAAAHLVISRSGASTVAELAAIGRPSILVPLPGALDQDQLANATVLQKAGGAVLLTQDVFTPVRLAQRDRRACRRAGAPCRHGGGRQGRRPHRRRRAAGRPGDEGRAIAGESAKSRAASSPPSSRPGVTRWRRALRTEDCSP